MTPMWDVHRQGGRGGAVVYAMSQESGNDLAAPCTVNSRRDRGVNCGYLPADL